VRLQRGALQRAGDRGYVVMIMEEPGDDAKPPGDYRYLVEESRADGLLLATTLRNAEHAPGVPGIPHVYVNRRGPDHGHDVVMDEPGAVRLFVEHVAGFGHRRVVLIDGAPDVDTVHRRVSAARRLCAASEIAVTVRHAAMTEEGRLGRHDTDPAPGAAAHRVRRRQPQPAVRRGGRRSGRPVSRCPGRCRW